MSLYICVIDPATDTDASGFEVTSAEFDEFRAFVADHIEGDFSVLLEFDPWDGEWTLDQARALASEATQIELQLRNSKVPLRLRSKASKRARARGGEPPRSMNDYFTTHDDEPMATTLHLLAMECIALEGTIRSQ